MGLFPLSSSADIAFDASSELDWASVGTTHTWGHTITGSDLVLVVESFTVSGAPPDTATYNGDPLTMQAQQDSYTGDSNNVSMWTITNPDTGTHNIVVTFAGSNTTTHSAASYTGVDTTDVPHKGATSGGGHASDSTDVVDTLVTTVDDSWLVSTVYGVDGPRETGSMVVRENSAAVNAGIHDLTTGTAGSHSMTWNNGGSAFRFGAHITIALAPVADIVASDPPKINTVIID